MKLNIKTVFKTLAWTILIAFISLVLWFMYIAAVVFFNGW